MTQVRRGLTFRYVKLTTITRMHEYAGDAYLATLVDRTDTELDGALEWCVRHDKTDDRERFIFLDPADKPYVDEIQRKLGTVYFRCLCRFRESIQHLAAQRMASALLMRSLPTPVNDSQYDVDYDRYRSALHLGRSARWLEDDVADLSYDAMVHLHRWADCVDKQLDGQHLVFVDATGTPIPAAQQKLYGWRFFNHLNQLRDRLKSQLIVSILTK